MASSVPAQPPKCSTSAVMTSGLAKVGADEEKGERVLEVGCGVRGAANERCSWPCSSGSDRPRSPVNNFKLSSANAPHLCTHQAPGTQPCSSIEKSLFGGKKTKSIWVKLDPRDTFSFAPQRHLLWRHLMLGRHQHLLPLAKTTAHQDLAGLLAAVLSFL